MERRNDGKKKDNKFERRQEGSKKLGNEGHLRATWDHLRTLWRHLEAHWGYLGITLEHF